jgi:DNA repair protein RadC
MTDREQTAVLGRLDNIAARHRRQTQVAADQMQVIARQQNNLAGLYHEAFSILTLNSDAKVALDDVVINNQVGRWSESGRAMLGRDARRYAPRREELGVQEHAAGQMRHPQDVG